MSHDLWTTYKHGAKARGLSFNIDIKFAWNLFINQNRKCALTGWDIYFNKTFKEKSNKTASLDRIDSTKGYEYNNVQWVHRDVNKLKKNMADEIFIEICHAVSKNKRKKKNNGKRKKVQKHARKRK